MSIRKRGKGAYQVRVPGFPAVTVPTREGAETVELQLKLRRKLGDLYVEPPSTLGEEIDSFLAWKRSAGDLSEAGLRYNEQSLRAWGPFRGALVSQLRRAEIEDAIGQRAAKHPRSAKNELELLKAVLRRAAARGQRVDEALLAIAAIRHTPGTGIALTPEQLDELASWFPEYLRRLPLVAGTVGARLSEWLHLTDARLELDAKPEPLMRVPRRSPGSKSRRDKSIPLTSREAGLLREQLLARAPGTPLVFPRRHGTPFTPGNLGDRYFVPAAIAAGLGSRDEDGHYEGATFHDLRHTAISLMARAGYRPEWIAERVGHSDGGALILRRYRHLYPAEMMIVAPRLDAMFATAPAPKAEDA